MAKGGRKDIRHPRTALTMRPLVPVSQRVPSPSDDCLADDKLRDEDDFADDFDDLEDCPVELLVHFAVEQERGGRTAEQVQNISEEDENNAPTRPSYKEYPSRTFFSRVELKSGTPCDLRESIATLVVPRALETMVAGMQHRALHSAFDGTEMAHHARMFGYAELSLAETATLTPFAGYIIHWYTYRQGEIVTLSTEVAFKDEDGMDRDAYVFKGGTLAEVRRRDDSTCS